MVRQKAESCEHVLTTLADSNMHWWYSHMVNEVFGPTFSLPCSVQPLAWFEDGPAKK